jgi:hypothetical protein
MCDFIFDKLQKFSLKLKNESHEVCYSQMRCTPQETMGVFGSLCDLEFTLPSEISHLIQASLRFCGVFASPYVLRDTATNTLFDSMYDWSHAIQN